MANRTFGEWGVWRRQPDLSAGFAARVEQLGFETLWIGGSPGEELASLEAALAETESLIVASSVVNIWNAEAAPVAASFHRLDDQYPGRVYLGIGSGHREATPHREKPLEAYARYLDELDAAGVPAERRLLAALGDHALEIARDRTLGSIPYFTTAQHTAHARDMLGADRVLAIEQGVIVNPDAAEARAIARKAVGGSYLQMHNYVSTLLRFGFDEADIADGGSDRLIDTMILHGDASEVVRALGAQRDAGADHIAIQIIGGGDDALDQLEQLAWALDLVTPTR